MYLRGGRNGQTERAELVLLVPRGAGKLDMRKSSRRNRVEPGDRLPAEDALKAAAEVLPDQDLTAYEVFGWYASGVPAHGLVAADVVQV